MSNAEEHGAQPPAQAPAQPEPEAPIEAEEPEAAVSSSNELQRCILLEKPPPEFGVNVGMS